MKNNNKKYKLCKEKAITFLSASLGVLAAVGLDCYMGPNIEPIEPVTMKFYGKEPTDIIIPEQEAPLSENISNYEVISSNDYDITAKEEYVYTNKVTDIYDNVEGTSIGKIEIYKPIYEFFTLDEEWAYVLSDDTLGYVKTSNLNGTPDTFVEVAIDEQQVRLYKDDEVFEYDCITGKDSTPSDIGDFKIYSKYTGRKLQGRYYTNYYMPYNGGEGLHDASWQKDENYDVDGFYHKGGSHGCINMKLEDVEEVYSNVKIGTKVLVHK